MITTSPLSILKRDIQTALAEIGSDREVFERAEINPESLRRSVEKYGQLIPASLFDYWHDKHHNLQQRIEDIENQGKSFFEAVQGYFKACIEAASAAGKQITEIVKTHTAYFSVNQVRAELDLLGQTVNVMVLLKGNWLEEENPSEEAMSRLSVIESDFFKLEEEFSHSYKFAVQDFGIDTKIRIDTHWLLLDYRLDTDTLTRDYPISVRL